MDTVQPQQFTEPIAITVVSNSHLLRAGLIATLSTNFLIRTIGSLPADPIGGAAFENPTGHIVLLDSGIGQDLCLRWAHHCRSLSNPARVVVVELHNDLDQIVACIEGGAHGYTLQGASPADVFRTVQQVNAGVAQCSPEVTARLFARLAMLGSTRSHLPPARIPLTSRELEVLRFVVRGHSNKQIADVLYIELRTVKQHVHNILEKLQVSHRYEAARFACEQGWIDDAFGVNTRRSALN